MRNFRKLEQHIRTEQLKFDAVSQHGLSHVLIVVFLLTFSILSQGEVDPRSHTALSSRQGWDGEAARPRPLRSPYSAVGSGKGWPGLRFVRGTPINIAFTVQINAMAI